MARRPGITLIEVLIVLAIMMLLGGTTSLISTQVLRNAEIDRIRESIRSELLIAQADSIAGTLDSAWGVAFTSDAITRYSGTSYAMRNPAYDRVTSFSNSSLLLTGTLDIAFVRPTGVPRTSGSIVVTDGSSTATTTVTAGGAIEIQ